MTGTRTPIEKKIAGIIAPTIEDMGYELVRVLMTGGARPTLQVMAEQPDGSMGVDDCEKVSRAVSALLDVENPVESAYTLEVSSPGMDRPLTRLKDFENYQGFDARVEIEPAIDGRKRFKGKLSGMDGDKISMDTDEGPVTFSFAAVQKAKLLLTDELIKSVQQREKA